MTEAFRVNQDRLRTLARRSREVLVVSAVVGTVTGFAVLGVERTVQWLEARLTAQPLWVAATAPTLGLLVAALALRYLGGGSPATADEYIRVYHDGTKVVPLRPFPGRLLASIATLGSGGALGLEGPSIYTGAVVGSVVTPQMRRRFPDTHAKVFMVAGAAAGVAAIFKAPATGAIFAIEVPYRDDFGRKLLLPALVGAATGYLAFASVDGTARLFDVVGDPAFDLVDLLGATALGVLAGLLARAISVLLVIAKAIAIDTPWWMRIVGGGAALAGLAVLADHLTGEPLTLGSGGDAVSWAADPDHAVWLVLAVLALRCAATAVTLGAGGVGGVFLPLAVAGVLLGRAVGGAIEALDTSLFAVVGISAVLGAGYRVPLASVMFVAETTGRPGFVVPGLLAAVTAELFMGSLSVTPYQTQPR